MQEMLDIVLDYAGDHRFQIHPVKSNAIIKTVGKRKIDRVAEKQNELKLGDNTLHFKSDEKASRSAHIVLSPGYFSN
jgi:hypothetical protein